MISSRQLCSVFIFSFIVTTCKTHTKESNLLILTQTVSVVQEQPTLYLHINSELFGLPNPSMDPETINSQNRPLFNSFRRLQEKYIKAFLHIFVLELYDHFEIVPRHLRVNIQIYTGFESPTTSNAWKNALHLSSLHLLRCLTEQYRNYCTELLPHLLNSFRLLKENTEPFRLNVILRYFKKYAEATWKRTINYKFRKLTRDLGWTTHF